MKNPEDNTQNLITKAEPQTIRPYATYEQEIQTAQRLINQQLAPGTRRVYQSDWQLFTQWCQARQLNPFTSNAEVIALFLASQFEQGIHPSTLTRRLAAIKTIFTSLNQPSPTENPIVRATVKGIRRDPLALTKKGKLPLTTDKLLEVLQYIPNNSLRDLRDRALLLMGFGGAFRRSELASIVYENITWYPEGMTVFLPQSKTDQEKQGQLVPIAKGKTICPIDALRQWLEISHITEGALFRSISKHGYISPVALHPNAIYHITKGYFQLAGFNVKDYSPHSLRGGFITSAAAQGKNPFKIMEVSRHKKMESLKGYIQFAQCFEDHAGEGLL